MELMQILNARLQAERKEGKTNIYFAKKAGCSQAHINDLLNHKKNVKLENMKFEMILGLFPEIRAILERELSDDSSSPHQTASANGDGAAASVGGIAIGGGSMPDYQRVMNTIIDDQNICDTCKIRVLKIIKDA